MAGLDDEAAVVALEPAHLQLLRVLDGEGLAGPGRLLAAPLGVLLDRAAQLAQLGEDLVAGGARAGARVPRAQRALERLGTAAPAVAARVQARAPCNREFVGVSGQLRMVVLMGWFVFGAWVWEQLTGQYSGSELEVLGSVTLVYVLRCVLGKCFVE